MRREMPEWLLALDRGTRAVDRWIAGAGAALWRARAELLQTLALLLGWALFTAGVVAVSSPVAWLFSIGLLLLSLCGWKFLYTLFRTGLYTLHSVTRESRR